MEKINSFARVGVSSSAVSTMVKSIKPTVFVDPCPIPTFGPLPIIIGGIVTAAAIVGKLLNKK